MSDMAELLERVKAASGPDREIDCRIDSWLKGRTFIRFSGQDFYECKEVAGLSGDNSIPGYTSSIDAALALVTKLLPGFRVEMRTADPTFESGAMRLPWASVTAFNKNDEGWKLGKLPTAYASTPALAILDALLTALQQRPDRQEG